MKHYSIILMAICLASEMVLANNLQIQNLNVASINPTEEFVLIQFDINWENSWRDNSNWDAVWVFIKYRQLGDTEAWQHATLNLGGHMASIGSDIETSNDGKGVFVYRNTNGSGNVNFDALELRWNYGEDSVLFSDSIEINVYGIEMVFVPEGSYYLGDGQTLASQTFANFEDANTGNPMLINSENTMILGGGLAGSLGNHSRNNQFINGTAANTTNCSGDGCLNGSGDDFNDVISQTLPGAFPKGFNGFYCMKYEMSQRQFVDMLNTLTEQQQVTLTDTSNFVFSGNLASTRYSIEETAGVYSTNDTFIPMIYLDWIRTAAYADWAALRPMTELEFEKACRGTNSPVVNEYAWGNPNIDLSDDLGLINIGLENEAISIGFNNSGTAGNSWLRSGNQTMQNLTRVGIFSANPSNSGRISGGSSFWGIQELSGHAWERAVSVGHPEGRKFTGLHGDGNLDENGYANTTNWPGTLTGNSVNSNLGVGYRGGGMAYPNPDIVTNARVSSRRLASAFWDLVINDDGARLVRTID